MGRRAHAAKLTSPNDASALPLLIAGLLPTTPQAQAIKHYLDNGGDLATLRRSRSFDEVHAVIQGLD